MGQWLNGSTPTVTFPMVASSDHLAALTGIVPTVNLSKNGGAFAASTNTAVEIANGWYRVALSATETNTNGEISFHCTGTGADPTQFKEQVVAYNPNDAVRLGLTALPNANAEAAGGLYTRGSGAGQVNQNANGQVDTRWVAGNVTVGTNNDKAGYTASTVSDKTGYSLSAAGVQAIWDALTSALTTVGSIGKRIADNLDAVLSSRLATSGYTAPDNTSVTAIKAKTDNLPASPAAVGSAMTLDMTQAVPASNTAQTVGDALNAARAQGFGRWTLVGTALTLYAGNGTTVVRTFTLDSATTPTTRT